jgi:hypothetical protein
MFTPVPLFVRTNPFHNILERMKIEAELDAKHAELAEQERIKQEPIRQLESIRRSWENPDAEQLWCDPYPYPSTPQP